MGKEMATSENVVDLRLELSKDKDENKFAEVTEVFGGDSVATVVHTMLMETECMIHQMR